MALALEAWVLKALVGLEGLALEGLGLEGPVLEGFGLLLPTSLTALLAFPGAEQLCQYLCQNI